MHFPHLMHGLISSLNDSSGRKKNNPGHALYYRNFSTDYGSAHHRSAIDDLSCIVRQSSGGFNKLCQRHAGSNHVITGFFESLTRYRNDPLKERLILLNSFIYCVCCSDIMDNRTYIERKLCLTGTSLFIRAFISCFSAPCGYLTLSG